MARTSSSQAAIPTRPTAGRSRILVVITTVILVAVLSTPTFLVLFVGMMPTLAALVADRSPQRYLATAVGGANIAGVVPFVLAMWDGAHSLSGAQAILSNVFALATMYSVAALGWVIALALPHLVAVVNTAVAMRDAEALRARQEKIVEEWGDDVRAAASGARTSSP